MASYLNGKVREKAKEHLRNIQPTSTEREKLGPRGKAVVDEIERDDLETLEKAMPQLLNSPPKKRRSSSSY